MTDELQVETKLNIARQLRPIRIAFLVPSGDERTLRLAVETNTCLWGGIQNPIVPIYGRKPKNWDGRWLWPGGAEYAKGLLNGFEPDFVVETKKGLAKNLDVPDERIISIREVLDPNRDPHVGYGVSMIDLLRHAYDKELKFVWKRKLKALWPRREAAQPSLFEAVAFGAYPCEPGLQYLSKAFADAFEPETLPDDAAAAFDALVSGCVTPLQTTKYALNERRGAGWRAGEMVLFLLDPTSTSDLIDFWNLRAWGGRYVPIPVVQAKQISPTATVLVTRAHVPLRGNRSIKRSTTLLKAPCVPLEALQATADLFRPYPDGALLTQDWMPRIWSARARGYDLDARSELVAASDDIDVLVNERRVRFALLEPAFDIYHGLAGLPRWANTIALRDFSAVETGLVYPEVGKDLKILLRASNHGGLQALRNGIAIVSTGGYAMQHWDLPDGQAVVRDWFSAHNLAFEPSAAGRTAVEVSGTLRGLSGLDVLANVRLLKCLNDASGGASILQDDLLALLKRERPLAAENLLRALVRHGILRLGMRVDCSVCETEGWFALEDLSDTLRCARCLRMFPFPSWHPPNRKWAYRTQGVFALPGFAHGAYATLLALRFLGPTYNAEMTWFPGGEVGPEKDKYELDLVAFWRKRYGPQGEVRVLMGECKTFGEFKQEEVTRFRDVAKQFPEVVRVFATLRPELTEREKKAITSLAKEGRRLRGSRSPVLVLTATELLGTRPPPYCYREAGGRFEQFKDANIAPMAGDDGLLGLCHLTQEIHLGMESYSATLDRELGRRRPRVQPVRNSPASGGSREGA